MKRRSALMLSAAASLATAGAFPSVARASDKADKAECLAASDQGQNLRDSGKYSGAREAFQTCSRDVCPAIVRRDCLRWLADLENTMPSVVVSAKDDKGNDLVDVTVTVDGKPLVAKLDGKPILVDPGDHVFRYEAAGYPAVEGHVLVHAGEKSRVLDVQFGGGAGAGAAAGAGATPPPAQATPEAPHSGSIVPAAIFGGVAVVAFASEAVFGLSGLSQRSSDLSSGGCAPSCSASEKSSIQTKFLIADISMGVGIVSAAAAAYLFFTRGSSEPAAQTAPSARVDVLPVLGGAAAGVSGKF